MKNGRQSSDLLLTVWWKASAKKWSNFYKYFHESQYRTVLLLDEILVKNSVALNFCQTLVRTFVRMLEVPGFKISFLGLKVISNVLSFSIGTLETISEFRMDVFWKSFFGGKRHFIYGPKSIWSKQIRGYKFSPHSRKVYNSQRKVELSFIVAGLASKFLWPFLRPFLARIEFY